mmetsp:Transcript_101023/g.253298  ORF Transcript_101023/g.253298 Transcript_101023/m.253298 type:complete len:200 (-) Transcript_101023:1384-1983(-)
MALTSLSLLAALTYLPQAPHAIFSDSSFELASDIVSDFPSAFALVEPAAPLSGEPPFVSKMWRRTQPSSEPDAIADPSLANAKVCTGPKWPFVTPSACKLPGNVSSLPSLKSKVPNCSVELALVVTSRASCPPAAITQQRPGLCAGALTAVARVRGPRATALIGRSVSTLYSCFHSAPLPRSKILTDLSGEAVATSSRS